MIRSFGGKTPAIDPSVYVDESAAIVGDVVIGAGSSVWFNAVVRGDVHFIRIGRETNIQDLAVVHVTSGRHPTVIGDRVTVAHHVVLHGCTIEDGSLIGIGARVLDRAVVGAESLVGAGALVTEGTIIPPRSLVLGAPARVKRPLNDEELERMRQNAANYVEYARRYRAEAVPG